MSKYIRNNDLFNGAYLKRVIADTSFPRKREPPTDAGKKLKRLLELWIELRGQFVNDLPESKPLSKPFTGLPATVKPIGNVSEGNVENLFAARLLEDVLEYSCDSQKTILLDGLPDKKQLKKRRPDIILFRDRKAHQSAVKESGKDMKTTSGVKFCRDADFVMDVKRFDKGVGSDETKEEGKKRKDAGAAQDVDQVLNYIKGCGKTWGVLTNGRSWRLMRQGKTTEHLRFDLVLLLEDLRKRYGVVQREKVMEEAFTEEDLNNFGLFYYFFGHPAVGGGYLDLLHREGEADNRRVSDILRENAHQSVQMIAEGFRRYKGNNYPEKPSQSELDHLRELSLIFLYRLLFILKAEAQGLLPMWTETGAETTYARFISTKAIFSELSKHSDSVLQGVSECFDKLKKLFGLINTGGEYDVPAYNGGLFDNDIHKELAELRLNDVVIKHILNKLIYLTESESVPYADLDVRDFGDIYEGLLEQRLVLDEIDGGPCLALRNKKGERKASGSYFTPESLVDHIVRETITPLLDACKKDPLKILSLKILDPAMGSAHFLVKVVDVIAWRLTVDCDPLDKGAPDDNGPAEYEYWKRKVVENCIYGVDMNPMAVELAKVALWLHTASLGQPLSFLDHHLKCGNSLVGADLGEIAGPGLESRKLKSGVVWEPVAPPKIVDDNPAVRSKKKKKKESKQLELPFPIDTHLFSGILESVSTILHRPSNTPADIKNKRRDYLMKINQRLEAHRLLCDLWCAQWFIVEPDQDGVAVYESYNGLYARLKEICGVTDEDERRKAIEKINDDPFVKRIMKACNEGYGPRPMRFFHWQLEFPEVAFTEHGELKESFGFHALVGNPPWDKVKPAKRDFYGPFNEEVANRQGRSLDTLIAQMEKENPELEQQWAKYERVINRTNEFLSQNSAYKYQVAYVDGKKTGGDPDLFRYFTERTVHCISKNGRVGFLVPCTLWQGQGCTGLRRLLFEKCKLSSIYTFENYRKWAFDIDSRFKFTAFSFESCPPPENHTFPAAFMLRDTKVFEGKMQERVLNLSAELVQSVSPASMALIDVKSEMEARFIKKIHEKHPLLGNSESGWNPFYKRELDMTNDSWRFKTREWMKDRGFTKIFPKRHEDGTWTQEQEGPASAALPESLPEGGEYWISADVNWYRERRYIERTVVINGKEKTFFIHPDDLNLENSKKFDREKDYRRIFPGERYTALYEGRMVHIFDHTQKRYLRGEGRKAIWEDISINDKQIQSRIFICKAETEQKPESRIAFCDITGATNERSILASLLGAENLAGNTTPCLMVDSTEKTLILLSILCSFCSDLIIRYRISTHVNWIYLANLAVPAFSSIPDETKKTICKHVVKLNCTTPELADVWNAVFPDAPWTYQSAERDLWKRAEIRADLDAIVAELYELTVEEYACILTGFPLLDRDQPPLPGDYFLTEGDDRSKSKGQEGVSWIETEWGVYEMKPRSFITRDLALRTYMQRKNYPPPQKLDEWFRDKAGLDPEGSLSRFRIGETKDLIERITLAKKQGSVAYAPTNRGGD